MPSPSMSSSCHSCSNSSSPTGNGSSHIQNSGLLVINNKESWHVLVKLISSLKKRCFSPSTTLLSNNNNSNNGNGSSLISQNYFSPSPSPTRKLFVTRRSMSPVTCQLRPSALKLTKRKRISLKKFIYKFEEKKFKI